jgi:hypothetical protein
MSAMPSGLAIRGQEVVVFMSAFGLPRQSKPDADAVTAMTRSVCRCAPRKSGSIESNFEPQESDGSVEQEQARAQPSDSPALEGRTPVAG